MKKTSLAASVLAPLVVFLVVGSLWHFAVDWFRIPAVILPKPETVLRGMWTERVSLLRGAWVTFQAAFMGLGCSAVLGTLIAMVFSQSAWIRTAFYPYVLFLQTVPIVAIAPLLIIWSGLEFRTVVLVATIISIFSHHLQRHEWAFIDRSESFGFVSSARCWAMGYFDETSYSFGGSGAGAGVED